MYIYTYKYVYKIFSRRTGKKFKNSEICKEQTGYRIEVHFSFIAFYSIKFS